MHATVGDRLHLHGRVVGQQERVAEVIEVHGPDGTPPYKVRYPDGHETIMSPGPDCEVEVTRH